MESNSAIIDFVIVIVGAEDDATLRIVEVLEPLWLRKEMTGIMKRMWNNYNKTF